VRRRLESSMLGPALIVGIVAASLFWIAYDNGSYGVESRNSLAIAIWWTVIVVIVFGLLPKERVPRAALVLGALLAALVLWTSASLLGSVSSENAFDEVNRVSLYLGLFVVVILASSRRSLAQWIGGLAIATSAVAAVALVARLFPGSFPGRDLDAFLPAAATRLSFPLGYWNGLAILVALGVPLLLSIAVVSRVTAIRGLALAPMPVIASVIYLASSRGGVAAATVGVAAFLVLTDRRWTAVGALATSAVGGAAAIAVLLRRDELVNGPLGTGLVEGQGRTAAVLIALACAATSVTYAYGSRGLRTRRIEPPPAVNWAAVVVAVIALAVAVTLADPVERFRAFKTPPGAAAAIDRGDFVKQHLLSSSGSGRWQFWSAAVDQWRQSPVWGDGAGSFEAWWAEHGSIALFVKDAHSLYLETLGELGVIGLALVLALVSGGIVVGAQRAARASGDSRAYAAAATAVFIGYATAAGIDWVWELTAVSVVGLVSLALAVGRATAAPAPLSAVDADAPHPPLRRRFGIGVAAILVAWLLLFAQAIPLFAQREIGNSQAAVRRGDLSDALAAAKSAREIQPWAATPYVQLALVSEQAGALTSARAWIDMAIARDRTDWRIWLASARIETRLGRVKAAERSLRRAVELNPRSPLLKGIAGPEAP
jgi:O-Antigen ligase